MKVLVTGGCGFLGSHVCSFYAERGDSVIAYDNLTRYELGRTGYAVERARQYNCDYLDDLGIQIAEEDIRDLDTLMDYAAGVDFIVHTAAQPAMTIAIEDAGLDFSTNVQGTFNVLEAVRRYRVPMVNCGSIHIYGNSINETLAENKSRYLRTPPAIDETHPVVQGNLTPLHASKRSAELYVETYRHTYKLPVASFRLTGLYGPRQFGGEDHGWVANFSIRALLDQPIRVFGTGKQVRDILFASDVARAFHAFYMHGKPGIYNLGGGLDYSISLLECIDFIGDITGRPPRVEFEDMRLGDLLYFVCDSSKAERELRWTPEVSPKKGIARLIRWIEKEIDIFKGVCYEGAYTCSW
jgi:CDP-paratose 2-epimerase